MKKVNSLNEAKDFFLSNSSGSVICVHNGVEKEVDCFPDAKDFFNGTETYNSKDTESPISLMTDGHLGLNLGNGLSLDMSDGSLGLNIGGGLSINL